MRNLPRGISVSYMMMNLSRKEVKCSMRRMKRVSIVMTKILSEHDWLTADVSLKL
jgi:hypothetical protein